MGYLFGIGLIIGAVWVAAWIINAVVIHDARMRGQYGRRR